MSIIGKPKLIRKINRELLIQVLLDKQIVTNTELSNKTGLSRRTINLILNSLKDVGIVTEEGLGISTSEGGKRPILYRFNPDSFFSIGILLRDKKLNIGICNLNGKILLKNDENINWTKDPQSVIDQIINLVKKNIKKSGIDKPKFLGIGIGLPGLVDFEKGTIRILTRQKNWENIQLVKILTEELQLNVVVDNENSTRTLGEKWFGIAKNTKDFVTIIITSNGIGCGIVKNNELLRSENLLLGELGHIKVPENNKDFKNFKDFEYYLGSNYINELVVKHKNLKSFSYSPLGKIFSRNSLIKMEDVFNGYNYGDEYSRVIVEELSHYFALLINIINCNYDPNLIIIHGKYTILNESFFKKITRLIEDYTFPGFKNKIIIKKSFQTKEMAVLGASGMVFEEVSF